MTAQESENLSFETTTAPIGVRSDAIAQTRWEANRSGDGSFMS
jgi:hypothetical protein